MAVFPAQQQVIQLFTIEILLLMETLIHIKCVLILVIPVLPLNIMAHLWPNLYTR